MTIPPFGSRLRLIALIYGGLLLLWASLEDNTVLPAALIGGGLALISATIWVTRRYGKRRFEGRAALVVATLLGAAIGAISALATALLMLIKDGIHSHLYPDYPFGVIAEMVLRAPLWGLAGALAGLGLLLAWQGLRESRS